MRVVHWVINGKRRPVLHAVTGSPEVLVLGHVGPLSYWLARRPGYSRLPRTPRDYCVLVHDSVTVTAHGVTMHDAELAVWAVLTTPDLGQVALIVGRDADAVLTAWAERADHGRDVVVAALLSQEAAAVLRQAGLALVSLDGAVVGWSRGLEPAETLVVPPEVTAPSHGLWCRLRRARRG